MWGENASGRRPVSRIPRPGYGDLDGRLRRTRTDYAINRYYSPDTGRFTTHDPLTELDRPERMNQPQGLNLYPYVMGGPTRYTDPDGQDVWVERDGRMIKVPASQPGDYEIPRGVSRTVSKPSGPFLPGDKVQVQANGAMRLMSPGPKQTFQAGTTFYFTKKGMRVQRPGIRGRVAYEGKAMPSVRYGKNSYPRFYTESNPLRGSGGPHQVYLGPRESGQLYVGRTRRYVCQRGTDPDHVLKNGGKPFVPETMAENLTEVEAKGVESLGACRSKSLHTDLGR